MGQVPRECQVINQNKQGEKKYHRVKKVERENVTWENNYLHKVPRTKNKSQTVQPLL